MSNNEPNKASTKTVEVNENSKLFLDPDNMKKPTNSKIKLNQSSCWYCGGRRRWKEQGDVYECTEC